MQPPLSTVGLYQSIKLRPCLAALSPVREQSARHHRIEGRGQGSAPNVAARKWPSRRGVGYVPGNAMQTFGTLDRERMR